MRGKIFLLLFFGILLIGIVSAATYCCEKTTGSNPAFCQNVNDKTQCDSNYKILSTPCASTSFCASGTCVNQKEGTCMPSTQTVCTANGGFWSSKKKTELPQCQLGCCLMGDQAAFVTQVACNRMGVLYGIGTTYQSNVNDELTCLASANPQAKGACVYNKNYQTTCEMTTKKDCQDMATSSTAGNVSFHEGYLCSAQELETICGKTQKTICGNDGNVYFVDSCGNLANIYDSSKVNDENYWTKLQDPTCTSSNNPGNKNSASCGSCDYYSGSMCKEKKSGDNVDYGNNFCKSLDCVDYRGPYVGSSTGFATATNYPKHGETWCATDSKTGNSNSPGATDFKLTCYNGEVNTPEECQSGKRETVCIQNYTVTSAGSKFYTANCKANVWGDCFAQASQSDCEDINVRDCKWIASAGYNFTGSSLGLQNIGSSGMCVPNYAPGFSQTPSSDVTKNCAQASSTCFVKMEKPLIGDWRCTQNCSCLDSSWQSQMNGFCTQLGDCGNQKNYLGKDGYAPNQISIQTGSSG